MLAPCAGMGQGDAKQHTSRDYIRGSHALSRIFNEHKPWLALLEQTRTLGHGCQLSL